MNLTEIFGSAWIGSGTRGFFGEGYWHHQFFSKDLFNGSTFVAKTTPFDSNKGNMPLTANFTPKELLPRCIWIDPVHNNALNSVGLASPGFVALLAETRWQLIEEPLFLSFMPIKKTEEEQLEEVRSFAEWLSRLLFQFRSHKKRRLGLQLNISCPNVGADLSKIVSKARMFLDVLAVLGIPIIVKINLPVEPRAAVEIAQHPACSGLCISNTLPFGEKADDVDWDSLFPDGSPLLRRNKQFGGGGLSGELLFPLVINWVDEFRCFDDETYINAGGGVTAPEDVDLLARVGANSISFATVAMTRPWRVPEIIKRAHELFA